ncbi:hypothetical protein [Dyella sp. A6]|uniref:hypothetical protein n=1 Tax=Dyella aluminiiresistens TaxID=3069105 RepID=UPI002E7970A5|nr:hypothetical protein [Dyella sp. A6]
MQNLPKIMSRKRLGDVNAHHTAHTPRVHARPLRKKSQRHRPPPEMGQSTLAGIRERCNVIFHGHIRPKSHFTNNQTLPQQSNEEIDPAATAGMHIKTGFSIFAQRNASFPRKVSLIYPSY